MSLLTSEEAKAQMQTNGGVVNLLEGRTPPTHGSAITKVCQHDFQFLRTEQSIICKDKDIFFCRHCLEYREVVR